MPRLQKILSAHGIASRRAAEDMIRDGRVSINGAVATLGESADETIDLIEVDGVPLKKREDGEQFVYIMLNKPRGFLTTKSDDRGRKTVMELLTDVPVSVYPVGRLDMSSEGMLLFTNDGDFANKVAHPSYSKIKMYQVSVVGDVLAAEKLLGEPVIILQDDNSKTVTVKAASVKVVSQTQTGGVIKIGVFEGRNRQVRKMCTVCGLRVLGLKRISIAQVTLGALETGKWRYLDNKEVQLLG